MQKQKQQQQSIKQEGDDRDRWVDERSIDELVGFYVACEIRDSNQMDVFVGHQVKVWIILFRVV